MRKKFKRGEFVIINGIGKKDKKRYINKLGKVIYYDDFFCDYNVSLSNTEEDWFYEYSLTKLKKYLERKRTQK